MSNYDFTPFLSFAEENSIEIYEGTLKKLEVYGDLLKSWNRQINLTAITDNEGIVIKHFTDSLAVLKFLNIKENTSLIDVGTGAGFPGMVLKILRPELNVTLLDGHAKRFIFLEDLQNNLGIKCENIHKRAELLAKEKGYRDSFDYATARAVARLNTLTEYCLPFVKIGGEFLSLKGPDLKLELSEAKRAIETLGGSLAELKSFNLPGGDERNIAVIKKIKATSEKYPRASAKINKSPL